MTDRPNLIFILPDQLRVDFLDHDDDSHIPETNLWRGI